MKENVSRRDYKKSDGIFDSNYIHITYELDNHSKPEKSSIYSTSLIVEQELEI